MRVRHDDIGVEDPNHPREQSSFRVVREIPLWGILAVIGTMAAQAIGLYYGQQRMVEKMTDQSTIVQELRTSVQNMQSAILSRERELVVLQMKMEQMDQRVSSNERRLDSVRTVKP